MRILNDDSSGDCLGLIHGALELALGDVLDRTIDGENQVLTGIWLALDTVVQLATGIDRDQLFPWDALQIVVELALDPTEAFAVQANVTERLRQQFTFGIKAFGLFAEVDAA